MIIEVTNNQRSEAVDIDKTKLLASNVMQQLAVNEQGIFYINFIGEDQMKKLNKKFKNHSGLTDVLCFRYDESMGSGPLLNTERILGEVLIAPKAARNYANNNKLSYRKELSRYVIHGILHWLGYEDATEDQIKQMRIMEDNLIASCS